MSRSQSTDENASEREESTAEADDLPETVFVKSGTGKRVFHTTTECAFCPDVAHHWDRESALEWGMRPCTWCADDGTELGGDQGGKRKELYNRLVELGKSSASGGADD